MRQFEGSNIPLLAEEGWPKAGVVRSAKSWKGGRTDYSDCFALSRSRFAPVCADKGGFATLFLIAPPLCEEGNVATHKKLIKI